nr:hypothetical protein [Tanacetum cinerariifolium]
CPSSRPAGKAAGFARHSCPETHRPESAETAPDSAGASARCVAAARLCRARSGAGFYTRRPGPWVNSGGILPARPAAGRAPKPRASCAETAVAGGAGRSTPSPGCGAAGGRRAARRAARAALLRHPSWWQLLGRGGPAWVLPVPGPATTSNGSVGWVTAARCRSLRRASSAAKAGGSSTFSGRAPSTAIVASGDPGRQLPRYPLGQRRGGLCIEQSWVNTAGHTLAGHSPLLAEPLAPASGPPPELRTFLLMLLSSGGLFFTSCADKKEEKEEQIKLLVTSPLAKDTTITKEYVAQIHAYQHIELRALEKGYLQKIFVDEGQLAEANYVGIEYKNTKNLADSNIVSKNELALAKAKFD